MNKFEILKKSLDLKYNPIGIKLIFENETNQIPDKFNEPKDLQRYCAFVKKAAQGEFIKIKKGDFSCVTAEIMLGFKKPKKVEMNMRMNIRGLNSILLFPANKYNLNNFESIILIVTPKNCMDIIEAHTRIFKKQLKISCGLYTGVCSEVTAQVIKTEKINFSFLCSGSRFLTGFDECELFCGIPSKMIDKI
ncbi:MAG: hypothetical protein EU550_03265, partial [Promethearchaeota archaeon]